MQTFLEAWAAGEAVPDDVDDWVDRWHHAGTDSEIGRLPLHGYLGLTWSQYQDWVEHPAWLLQILTIQATKQECPPHIDDRLTRADD